MISRSLSESRMSTPIQLPVFLLVPSLVLLLTSPTKVFCDTPLTPCTSLCVPAILVPGVPVTINWWYPLLGLQDTTTVVHLGIFELTSQQATEGVQTFAAGSCHAQEVGVREEIVVPNTGTFVWTVPGAGVEWVRKAAEGGGNGFYMKMWVEGGNCIAGGSGLKLAPAIIAQVPLTASTTSQLSSYSSMQSSTESTPSASPFPATQSDPAVSPSNPVASARDIPIANNADSTYNSDSRPSHSANAFASSTLLSQKTIIGLAVGGSILAVLLLLGLVVLWRRRNRTPVIITAKAMRPPSPGYNNDAPRSYGKEVATSFWTRGNPKTINDSTYSTSSPWRGGKYEGEPTVMSRLSFREVRLSIPLSIDSSNEGELASVERDREFLVDGGGHTSVVQGDMSIAQGRVADREGRATQNEREGRRQERTNTSEKQQQRPLPPVAKGIIGAAARPVPVRSGSTQSINTLSLSRGDARKIGDRFRETLTGPLENVQVPVAGSTTTTTPSLGLRPLSVDESAEKQVWRVDKDTAALFESMYVDYGSEEGDLDPWRDGGYTGQM